jgi:hypothetical protein
MNEERNMKHALFLIRATFSQINTTGDWIVKYKLKNADRIVEAIEGQ